MPLTIALISEVFPQRDDTPRLNDALARARSLGAELAVLPELPLNHWSPATKRQDKRDSEAPRGWRYQTMSDAARTAGIGLIGGAIIRDSESQRRYNTALVFDRSGTLVDSYRKLHLPEEEGFWETYHYAPGDALACVIESFSLRLGVQICSDINRPEGSR